MRSFAFHQFHGQMCVIETKQSDLGATSNFLRNVNISEDGSGYSLPPTEQQHILCILLVGTSVFKWVFMRTRSEVSNSDARGWQQHQ